MGVCGGPLATPLSPTPPQVGYVPPLPHLLLPADLRAGSTFCLVLFAGCTALLHRYAG